MCLRVCIPQSNLFIILLNTLESNLTIFLFSVILILNCAPHDTAENSRKNEMVRQAYLGEE